VIVGFFFVKEDSEAHKSSGLLKISQSASELNLDLVQ
jgi:hypothetical protein